VKRLMWLCMLTLIAAGVAYSQDWDNPELLKRLELEEAEIEKIRGIFEETEKLIREARLEIDVLRAQLKKLLFQEQVNMREVERLLRQSLDWELKERMAQIRRQVELRELLGDGRYARLIEAMERRRRMPEEQERRLHEEREKAESGRP
jgi:hypothetical protein